jgi:putative protein-disulfide isomerase
MAPDRIVWYVADPMCSWCWGFTPVIDAIEATYRDRLTVTMAMGGLRPGTTAPMPAAQREEILHHWQEVHRRTGQAFTFDGAMPDGFVYDTEPACRAVVAMAAVNPAATRAYFERVQAAFYMEGRDVTRPRVLAALAAECGVAIDRFEPVFNSAEAKTRTREEFVQVYRWGVRGFPTVLLQHAGDLSLLTHGYRPFEELRPVLDAWLSEPRGPGRTGPSA